VNISLIAHGMSLYVPLYHYQNNKCTRYKRKHKIHKRAVKQCVTNLYTLEKDPCPNTFCLSKKIFAKFSSLKELDCPTLSMVRARF
jgi:hypothetical protein